jgi:DNA-directed RNA polymerase subunit beta'
LWPLWCWSYWKSRDRVGHINLVVPIAHIWYFRSNKIGYILGLPSKKLDMIIYYERYVIQAGKWWRWIKKD